jgi:tRNA threonylcarbamoyladenosine biosynthesis protein TsaB
LVRDGVVVAEAARRAERSHAAFLPDLVTDVLATADVDVRALEAVAVSIGPGSFTGLRIGLAFAKGLAYAAGIPVAPVSTLEAWASGADAEPGTSVCAAIDARKGEIYAALFSVAPDGTVERRTADLVWTAEGLAAALPIGTLVVGDADTDYGEVLAARGRVRPAADHPPRGGMVARIGADRLARGERGPLAALQPVYVRPADATLPERPLR